MLYLCNCWCMHTHTLTLKLVVKLTPNYVGLGVHVNTFNMPGDNI